MPAKSKKATQRKPRSAKKAVKAKPVEVMNDSESTMMVINPPVEKKIVESIREIKPAYDYVDDFDPMHDDSMMYSDTPLDIKKIIYAGLSVLAAASLVGWGIAHFI